MMREPWGGPLRSSMKWVTALPGSCLPRLLWGWALVGGRLLLGIKPKCLHVLHERYFSLSLPHCGKTRNG